MFCIVSYDAILHVVLIQQLADICCRLTGIARLHDLNLPVVLSWQSKSSLNSKHNRSHGSRDCWKQHPIATQALDACSKCNPTHYLINSRGHDGRLEHGGLDRGASFSQALEPTLPVAYAHTS